MTVKIDVKVRRWLDVAGFLWLKSVTRGGLFGTGM